jgi:hypothetical protein
MCIAWDLNDNLVSRTSRVYRPAPAPAAPFRKPRTGWRAIATNQRHFDRRTFRVIAVSPGRTVTMPTSTATRTPSQPQTKPQPSEDEREQARRALQTSMDTRQ